MNYEHLSIKANRSENTFSAQQFSFLIGFQSQEIKLSEIEEMWANHKTFEVYGSVRTTGNKIIKVRPILKMKNGEDIFLLDEFKEELFSFNAYVGFNHFLKHSQENTFSKRPIYMGAWGVGFLIGFSFTLLVMLVGVFFIGNVKIILDKQSNTYKTKYLSPLHKNKKGSLSEIQNVLLISEVSKSFGKKQAGLYLNLKNKEMILLKSLGFYDQEQVTEESLAPFQANGKKIADFLEV